MKQLTRTEAQDLKDRAVAFTNGGGWSILDGGQYLITIDAIETEDGRVHLVEIRKTIDDATTTHDDETNLEEMIWIEAWAFEDAHAAVAFYVGKVSESALNRMQKSI